MIQVVTNFFSITGIDMTPPATFSELIPYLLTVVVGVVLVLAVFKVIGAIASSVMNGRWWR